MDKTYTIAWKSRSSGRAGQGKKLMEKKEAEALAAELNQEYPAYEHRVVNLAEPQGEALAPEVALETPPERSELEMPLQPETDPPSFSGNVASGMGAEVTAYDNHKLAIASPAKKAA